MHTLAQFLLFSAALQVGTDNVSAHCQTDEQIDDQIDQSARSADGGNGEPT